LGRIVQRPTVVATIHVLDDLEAGFGMWIWLVDAFLLHFYNDVTIPCSNGNFNSLSPCLFWSRKSGKVSIGANPQELELLECKKLSNQFGNVLIVLMERL